MPLDAATTPPRSATGIPRWGILVLVWLSAWAIYSILAWRVTGFPWSWAVVFGLKAMGVIAALAPLVRWGTRHVPWPRTFDAGFVLRHLVHGLVFSFLWILLVDLLEAALEGVSPAAGRLWNDPFVVQRTITGGWLYGILAGAFYTEGSMGALRRAEDRATKAEALASRAQLAELQSRLKPHFLFNTLNAVLGLLRAEPERAERALERLSLLLQALLEDPKELVPLGEELIFVEHYLELEKMRREERLSVVIDVPDGARRVFVPLFAVQTLVENAVRHGLAPREAPGTVRLSARMPDGRLVIRVEDDGVGAEPAALATATGLGLRSLRERLTHAFGAEASLLTTSAPGAGFRAELSLPAGGAQRGAP